MFKCRSGARLKSAALFKLAQGYLPGGVNSPVRAFKGVGGTPVFACRGKGPLIWDENGKAYIDYCGSWGALFFGHAPAPLIQTLQREIPKGTSFGMPTAKEVLLARAIHAFYPAIEKVRLVSSGTEAVMSAVRLARGFTGRDKILKIEGGYHGHVDSLLVKAGSGGATFGIPDSAGIPADLARHTLTVPFNDFDALENIFRKQGREMAALILEPVPANMGVVFPCEGYLEKARELTRRYGALLIFDEVITGFRISKGGAQEYYEIKPDLTCLGKILGGGLPLAAFGGRKEIMECLAPEGPVYQAGTLSGNPVATTAALWMMNEFAKPAFEKTQKALDERAFHFYHEISAYIRKQKLPVQLNAVASMFTLFFSPGPVTGYASAKKSDTKCYARFFHACLKSGVYLAPSQFEANFISTAHSEKHLETTLTVFRRALKNRG